jgi:Domain of unknown function (DUF4160)
MPVVANVDGVKIMFYASEHPPSHFHAEYSGDAAVVDIMTATITEGFLPVAKRRKVLAWTKLNRAKLIRTFHAALAHEPLEAFE